DAHAEARGLLQALAELEGELPPPPREGARARLEGPGTVHRGAGLRGARRLHPAAPPGGRPAARGTASREDGGRQRRCARRPAPLPVEDAGEDGTAERLLKEPADSGLAVLLPREQDGAEDGEPRRDGEERPAGPPR